MSNSQPKARRLRGQVHSFFETLEARKLLTTAHPSVADVSPAPKATNVPIDAFVSCDVNLVGPGQVVDSNSVTKTGDVILVRISDGANIPGVANTTGGGDAIIFTPAQQLDLNTKYQFTVTAKVTDTAGHTFSPFTSTFTTSPTPPTPPPKDIRFDKVPLLTTAVGKQFTCVAVGPDHRLYAADMTGYIIRYDILDDGTLGASKTITTVRDHNGGSRLITGLLFGGNPKSPDVYVSHGFSSVLGSPDNTGKISLLTGKNLDTYKDLVINLPRSFKDHLTDQMAWGPDSAIYWCQPSMTAMGAPDDAWGQRSEHLLSATILRLDLTKLGSGTLDARTADAGGSFDPFASNSPLTIYADGVRNAYDLIWSTDEHLFAATNGSAGGGNTPAGTAPYTGHRLDQGTNGPYTGPDVPAEMGVVSQPDYLYDIKKGGYYGHPNPLRDEYVMNGGNPTANLDKGEVSEYPVGTQPDRNYRGFVFNFGQHESPDGGIEYLGNAFGGKLKHQLLYVQYSGGDNIVALKRSGGTITSSVENIVGFTGFVDPLDLTQDAASGNIYVAEYGGERITLLRPDESQLNNSPTVSANPKVMKFDAVRGQTSPTQVLTIKNTGGASLTVNQVLFTGAEPTDYTFINKPPLPIKLAPGASFSVQVAFKPSSSGKTGFHLATLQIQSTDANHPNFDVPLRGFALGGLEGANEPSLQRILDLYQIPVRVGDNTPDETNLPLPPAKGSNEIVAQTLLAADTTTPVSIDLLASFSASANPLANVGFYNAKSGAEHGLFSVLPASYQQVDVKITGTQHFLPGGSTFGIYVTAPHFGHTSFSQDSKNTWAAGGPANERMLRFYPLKNSAGAVVKNAYVVAVEEEPNASDQQDLVFIIRNVKPASAASSGTTTTPPPAVKSILAGADIGNPTPAGSLTALSDTGFDMTAGGADILGNADQFHYAYQARTGNFDVKVRVKSLAATDVWSKAGLMVRNSLKAGAQNVFMLTSPTKLRFTYRADTNGTTTTLGAGTPTFPNTWLRLQRSGNTYTGYASSDGVKWTVISSVTIDLGKTLFVGLAATSHNTTKTTTAEFRG
jgi:glucose/arabinose dehydrogenase